MKPSLPRPLFFLLIAALGLGLTACKPKKALDQTAATTESAEKRYPLTGTIIKADTARLTLLVKHDAIPDYMAAMTMEFVASAGDVANAREGQRIRAELVERADDELALEKIWPIDAATEAQITTASNALRQDTSIRGRHAYREIGENLPDFALYDQTGQIVSPARFRGKQVMINFIFARCQIAAMCPLATATMTATQQKAREAGVTNLELISITLDPEHDTPGVLRTYAQQRGIDTSNFSFLTGPERAIKDLLNQFGVLTKSEGSLLQHTVSTLLINAQGQIVWRTDGSKWSADEFVQKMQKP